MNELINITKATINNEEVNAVSGRELHKKLEVQTRFNDWISRRIDEYGFEEGKDFYSKLSKSTGNAARDMRGNGCGRNKGRGFPFSIGEQDVKRNMETCCWFRKFI